MAPSKIPLLITFTASKAALFDLNEKNLKYISDITVTKAKKNKSETTVHVLSSTIADRRYALNKAVLQILKDMFKYLCESDAYFECVKKQERSFQYFVTFSCCSMKVRYFL